MKQLNNILIRSVIFLLLFLLLSGYFGSWIVSTRLLYPFGFFIYGNLGKVLLFSVIAFVFLAKDKLVVMLNNMKHLTHKSGSRSFSLDSARDQDDNTFVMLSEAKHLKISVSSLLLAFGLVLLFPAVANRLLTYESFSDHIPLSLLAHAFVIAIPILLALGLFGVKFWGIFLKTFRKELVLCSLFAVLLYFLIFQIWEFWPFFSDLVLRIVRFLFSLTHDTVAVIPPRTLFIERFAVTVDQACSGLESFLLFTGLSALIAYVDRKKLHVNKFLLFYVFGLIGTFAVNVLRVYGIIWAGLIFSPQLAGTLFHTYLGLIFFLAYFVLLLKLVYPKILAK